MPDALFVRDGDTVVPSRLTQGPWYPDAQHGGAPAALLAGEVERMPMSQPMVVVRVTVELLRPVPIEPMQLTREMTRPGRRVQVIEVALHHGEAQVARAVGVRMRLHDLDLPFAQPEEPAPPPPSEGKVPRVFTEPGAFGTDGMEIRMVRGDFSEPGRGIGWFRLRVPVIAGNEPTPLETAVAAADFGNGVSSWDPDRNWLFINPDLTVYCGRPPTGEWICVDGVSMLHESGTGLAESRLFDRSGRFGRSVQSLLVEPLER